MKKQTPTSISGHAALRQAIQVLGGQWALANVCGKAQGHVSHWLKSGLVPAEFCPLIERATHEKGDRVRCEDLRQDVDWPYLRGKAKIPADKKAADKDQSLPPICDIPPIEVDAPKKWDGVDQRAPVSPELPPELERRESGVGEG